MSKSIIGLLGDPALRRAVERIPSAVPDPEVLTARIAWSALTEPGEGVSGRLVAECGPVAALQLVEDLVAGVPTPEIPGVTARDLETALARWRPRLDAGMVTALADAGAKGSLTVLAPEGDGWPARLDDLGAHAPLALWVRGDAASVRDLERSAALVGARAATPYGEHVSGVLAGELAQQGVTIVSGGAYGVDGAAHRAALGADGVTVAFVAGGADRVYPAAHANLFARIAQRGAVVAEVPPGGTPTKWRFLQRNRLIAAASAATVVVEAGWRSGSLNTAGHAAALGRPLGAVPGPVTSATSDGCHRLLREFDATCVTCAADVRELIGEWGAEEERRGEDRPRAEAIRVLDALGTRAWRTLDDIARRCGLSTAEVQAELGLLELEGRIECSLDGWRLGRTA